MSRQRDAVGDQNAKQDVTFSWLHEQLAAAGANDASSGPSKWEKRFLIAGAAMAGLGLLISGLSTWLNATFVQFAVVVCLSGELLGFAISFVMTILRDLPQFTRPREQHALELDTGFVRWRVLVTRLKEFPEAQRRQRLQFVRHLRERIMERMGLIYGSLQRLGLLPLLAALYLQFRDWEWGNWAEAFDVNLVAGILIWMMLLLYAGGWLLMGLRLRLDAYVSLLECSLEDPANESPRVS